MRHPEKLLGRLYRARKARGVGVSYGPAVSAPIHGAFVAHRAQYGQHIFDPQLHRWLAGFLLIVEIYLQYNGVKKRVKKKTH